jgi:uncharacterized membrane protein (UPF0127 family)
VIRFPASRNRKWLSLPSLLVAAACGAAPKNTATPTPVASGPRVVMPSSAVYKVELARTPEETTQGLMYRESLAPRTGMLFLFADASVRPFWMKNTMIPLDIIWMDADGRVVFISADTPPCKADPCPTYDPGVPARNVLEIAGGMAKAEKVEVGSTLQVLDVK